jgi:hypothetical protein
MAEIRMTHKTILRNNFEFLWNFYLIGLVSVVYFCAFVLGICIASWLFLFVWNIILVKLLPLTLLDFPQAVVIYLLCSVGVAGYTYIKHQGNISL